MKLFDTSPLIAILGNLNNATILRHLILMGYSLYVPNKVVEEVINNPENQHLHDMLKNKEIKKLECFRDEDIQKFRNRFYRLGKGESELILWAQRWKEENKKFCCIIDDEIARKTAELLGLKCKGTVGILHKLNGKGLIQSNELQLYFRRLEECGFRYKFK